MMSKARTALIFGAGYVLGAQAGRARYEQLKQQATRIAEHPKTQQFAHQAREKVTTRLPSSLSGRRGDATGNGVTVPEPGLAVTTEPDVDLTDAVEPTRPSHL